MEQLDPQGHPGQYETPDGWKPLQLLTETINIKGAEPVTQTVRITRHGPILGDALAAISSTIGTAITQPVAIEWTALQPGHLIEFALRPANCLELAGVSGRTIEVGRSGPELCLCRYERQHRLPDDRPTGYQEAGRRERPRAWVDGRLRLERLCAVR